MAKKRSFLARVPLAPIFAVMFGASAAIVVAATPQWLLEQWVAATGLGNFVSVAVPPLGIKARLLAIVAAFVLTGGVVWAATALVERLLAGPKARPETEGADDLDAASNDEVLELGGFVAPTAETGPRRPIFADRELGAPLMSDEALATAWRLPAAPVDDVEPDAETAEPAPLVLEAPEPVLVDVPFEPVAEAPELAEPLAVDEFELSADAAAEPAQLPGESTIDALIRRLEAGLAKRGTPGGPGPSAPAAAPLAPRPGDWLVNRSTNDDTLDGDTTRALATLRRMGG